MTRYGEKAARSSGRRYLLCIGETYPSGSGLQSAPSVLFLHNGVLFLLPCLLSDRPYYRVSGSGSGADIQHITGSSDKIGAVGCFSFGAVSSCLTTACPFDSSQYLQYLFAISCSGSPSFPFRVLLYSKIFYIRSTATGNILKAWVYTFLLQLGGIGICFEVLYLCPDAKLGSLEAVPFHAGSVSLPFHRSYSVRASLHFRKM